MRVVRVFSILNCRCEHRRSKCRPFGILAFMRILLIAGCGILSLLFAKMLSHKAVTTTRADARRTTGVGEPRKRHTRYARQLLKALAVAFPCYQGSFAKATGSVCLPNNGRVMQASGMSVADIVSKTNFKA